MTAYHSNKKSWNFVFRVRENKCFCWGSIEVLVQIVMRAQGNCYCWSYNVKRDGMKVKDAVFLSLSWPLLHLCSYYFLFFYFLSQIIGDATGSTLSVFLCLFRSLSSVLKEKTGEHYNSCSFSPHFLFDYRVGEHLRIRVPLFLLFSP